MNLDGSNFDADNISIIPVLAPKPSLVTGALLQHAEEEIERLEERIEEAERLLRDAESYINIFRNDEERAGRYETARNVHNLEIAIGEFLKEAS